MWRQGMRFRWHLDLRHPRLREVWALMWPSVIAGAAVQVNVLVNGAFASSIDGGRSWLGCAFRLMQFPIGVFGVSIATALLPAVSRHHAQDDRAGFGVRVREGLRLAWFFTVPAALGLAVLARPIIALIYQHGRFTAHDTEMTALALQAYSIGLCGYAALKVVVPCFYVLGLPQLPLRVSLLGIAVNLGLNALLMEVLGLGHAGLALTTSCIALLNFGQLAWALGRRLDLGRGGEWVSFGARLFLSSALMGGAAWGIERLLGPWAAGSFPRAALSLGAAIGGGGVVYFAASLLLRVEETSQAWGMIRRRLLRK
ncbi:MAG: lipid II flippase MurJ [Verrucomicrobium sp.]|nr:lipid II flippase MurJ [Verrucomicrobium sp.]